jgi:hypothetical protein
MADRPIAKFEDGRLWLDVGYPDYQPCKDDFPVWMKREVMRELSGPDAARAVEECTKALNQYEQHQKETQCVAAKA